VNQQQRENNVGNNNHNVGNNDNPQFVPFSGRGHAVG